LPPLLRRPGLHRDSSVCVIRHAAEPSLQPTARCAAAELWRSADNLRHPSQCRFVESALVLEQRATEGGAAFIGGGAMLFAHRIQVAELAVKRRLPTTCPLPEFVEGGRLISYGPSITDQNRRAAYFVDRILKGAKPADLPVEQPTKFYLTINMKTARALAEARAQ
jgi:hypothetical protein